MEPEPLPPDLLELEEQLARRSLPSPEASFRSRALRAMNDARPASANGGRITWRRLWQSAAAIALILNLAMSISNGIRFRRLSTIESNAARSAPWTDLSIPAKDDGSNDQFDTIASNALANLKPARPIGVMKTSKLDIEEVRQWATP
jgi:hypothetical protein